MRRQSVASGPSKLASSDVLGALAVLHMSQWGLQEEVAGHTQGRLICRRADGPMLLHDVQT